MGSLRARHGEVASMQHEQQLALAALQVRLCHIPPSDISLSTQSFSQKQPIKGPSGRSLPYSPRHPILQPANKQSPSEAPSVSCM